MKKWAFIGLAVFLMIGFPSEAFSQADSGFLEWGTINVRIFEGSTGAGAPPSRTSVSSFAQTSLLEEGEWEEDPEAQALRIRKAFNLKSVAITSAQRITLEKGVRGPAYVTLRIPNKADLSLELTVTDASSRKFLVEVFEHNDGTRSNLLSTEAGLPKSTYTVFGFKDLRGNPYFVALQIGEWILGPGGAARAVGPYVQPPKLIKMVEPIYPRTAREARIDGSVVMEAQTDIYGRVQNVKILRSIPLLDQAAIDAVRQWVYEPMVIGGKPQSVIFTVTVRFDLKDWPLKSASPNVPAEGPVRAIGEIKPPVLIKQVEPNYPKIAAEARVEGIVILEAQTDILGRIAAVKVLRSVPLLDQAAIDAVRQWQYEPMVINGKPREAVFTVTVRFTLDKGQPSSASMRMIPADGGGTIRILTSVAPRYPEEAERTKVEGTVILEASVDEEGLPDNIRVIRSVHPALDLAAIEALREWKFEPRPLPVVGGKTDRRTVIIAALFQIKPSDGRGEAQIGGVVGGIIGGVVSGAEGGVEGGVIKADLSEKAFREGAALPPVRALGEIKPPELVKRVEPAYPDIARAYGSEGLVILEVVTDVYGRVQAVKILRSVANLDQAALEAVRQWVYKPLLVEGKPRACIFTVTVRFTLK